MTGHHLKFHVPKLNVWMVSTVLLLALLAFSWSSGWSLTGSGVGKSAQTLSAEDVSKKCIDYINSNLVQPGTSVTLAKTNDLGGIYEVVTTYQGKNISVYSTKDGRMMFLSALDMTAPAQSAQQPSQEQPAPTKSDRPTVQLFVMSFCPYGQAAEKAMKPVADLLGDKASIEPHFIVSIDGTTVGSLHGDFEAKEDMRQACILKNYGQSVFWKYVDYVNNNCSKSNIDSCWKEAAETAGVDVTRTESCAASEGVDLMKADETLANQYGVRGSPTLVINGISYNGERTADAYKQAICSAFTTAPSECASALSATGSAVSGGCGA